MTDADPPLPPRGTIGLTGRTRYRTQQRFLRRPLLVLQVQERWTFWDELAQARKVDLSWRDARCEDLTDAPHHSGTR